MTAWRWLEKPRWLDGSNLYSETLGRLKGERIVDRENKRESIVLCLVLSDATIDLYFYPAVLKLWQMMGLHCCGLDGDVEGFKILRFDIHIHYLFIHYLL